MRVIAPHCPLSFTRLSLRHGPVHSSVSRSVYGRTELVFLATVHLPGPTQAPSPLIPPKHGYRSRDRRWSEPSEHAVIGVCWTPFSRSPARRDRRLSTAGGCGSDRSHARLARHATGCVCMRVGLLDVHLSVCVSLHLLAVSCVSVCAGSCLPSCGKPPMAH